MRNALRRGTPAALALGLAAAGAAYTWLLLYVILSIPIWVAFIAAGAMLATFAGALAVSSRRRAKSTSIDPRRGDIVVGGDAVRLNPLVNVGALRVRFLGAVALTLFAGWLLIETLAFPVKPQQAISFASAVAITALALLSYIGYRRRPVDAKQSVVVPSIGYRFAPAQAVSALVAVLGAWQIVATRVFSADHARWLSFENGCVMLVLGLALLVMHEFSSERVVHVLEVAGWDTDRVTATPQARTERAHA
jgi:hypothetical protein